MEIKSVKISLLLSTLIAALAVTGCKKESTGSAADKPVVIAYLTPGQALSVKLYAQKDISDTANYGAAITGQQLSVSNGSKTVQLTEGTAGTYVYNDATFLTAGKTYTLQFSYQGITVSASTWMPAKAAGYTATRTAITIPAVTSNAPGVTDSIAVGFKWNNADSLYHVLVFKNDDTSPWNIHPQMNSPINFTINTKKADYYNLYFRQLNYLGVYRAILYSVNKEYTDILISNANSSSQTLTDPPTNITNGFGIFTAMQADTITLTLKQ